MIALIIFLLFFIILLFLLLIKIRICFSIEVNNLDMKINMQIFNKNFGGKLLLKKIEPYSNLKRSVIKKKKFNFQDMQDVLNIVEIQNLNINIVAGTPFISFTVFVIEILNILVPSIYSSVIKNKKGFHFSIIPNYKDFVFSLKARRRDNNQRI